MTHKERNAKTMQAAVNIRGEKTREIVADAVTERVGAEIQNPRQLPWSVAPDPHDTRRSVIVDSNGVEPFLASFSPEFARFIVTAVNSHGALVEAIEGILETCKYVANPICPMCRAVASHEATCPLKKAEDALALAKGNA